MNPVRLPDIDAPKLKSTVLMKRPSSQLEREMLIIAGFVTLTLVMIGFSNLEGETRGLFSIVRILLTIPYLLFLPGYLYQSFVYPRRDQLQGNERIALSFVISIAAMPITAVTLALLGIPLVPASILISIALVVLVGMTLSYVRRRLIAPDVVFIIRLNTGAGVWWGEQTRTIRLLVIAGVSSFGLFVLMAALILLFPGPANFFTEFGVVGREGLARDYPRFIRVGDPFTVTLDVRNNEGGDRTYSVVFVADDVPVYTVEPFVLSPGEQQIIPVSFDWQLVGENIPLRIQLRLSPETSPYRTLILYVNASESSVSP